jgi:putative tricarboxylic transport membrane protein
LPPAILLFYVFAVDWLGFIPTAALVVAAVSLALGASLRLAIPLALLTPIGVHLIFGKLLHVPLAGGLLPMPW